MFPSPTKREIRHFHVVVVHRGKEMYKKRDHVQSCCFANINLLLCFGSLCRRYCHCLSSPLRLTTRGWGIGWGGGGGWLMSARHHFTREVRSNSTKNIIIISINVLIIFFFMAISHHHHQHHRHRHHQSHPESHEDLSDWHPVHKQCAWCSSALIG